MPRERERRSAVTCRIRAATRTPRDRGLLEGWGGGGTNTGATGDWNRHCPRPSPTLASDAAPRRRIVYSAVVRKRDFSAFPDFCASISTDFPLRLRIFQRFSGRLGFFPNKITSAHVTLPYTIALAAREKIFRCQYLRFPPPQITFGYYYLG